MKMVALSRAALDMIRAARGAVASLSSADLNLLPPADG
jgi:hypothetical protein